jgi:hypothetical protein
MNHYKFNVSHDGKHIFATEEYSCTDSDKAKKLYKLLNQKFPLTEGFRLDVTFWETYGHDVTASFIPE